MQKYIVAILLLITLFIVPRTADAHFLATDKKIGAVLHVDPNDEPVAGQQASFFFDFKDQTNKFTSQNCDCTFLINEAGKTIYSQELFQNSNKPNLHIASATFIFPQKDVYQVQVVGKPKVANAFQPFTLSWDFRVDQEVDPQVTGQQSNTSSKYTRFILIFGITFVLVIGFLIYSKLIRNNKHSEKGGRKNNEKNSSNQY